MLQNTTIKARLAFVLLLLSALMLGIGLMGLINLSNTNASLRTVYEDRLLAVGQLDRVIRSGNRMQLAIALASTEDPAKLPELLATIERERGAAQKGGRIHRKVYRWRRAEAGHPN